MTSLSTDSPKERRSHPVLRRVVALWHHKVRRALSLDEGDLKTARLDDVVNDFLGSPGRV